MKFFNDAEKAALTGKLKIEEGDLILFGADKREVVWEVLGRLRLIVAEMLKKDGKLTVPDDQWNFLWVVDFPLITFNPEAKRHVATHHPFTAPVAEDIALLDSEPTKVRGQHYDIVLNGVELGGGSIRIHRPDVQKKVFEQVLADSARRGAIPVRLHAAGVSVRRAAARRHRVGPRPVVRDPLRFGQYPRCHRVPEDGQSRGFDDELPERGRAETTPRPAHQAGCGDVTEALIFLFSTRRAFCSFSATHPVVRTVIRRTKRL